MLDTLVDRHEDSEQSQRLGKMEARKVFLPHVVKSFGISENQLKSDELVSAVKIVLSEASLEGLTRSVGVAK